MSIITDKQMQGAASDRDQWLTEDGPRGAGRFMARITRTGERAFYYRYTMGSGQRDTLPIGTYDARGQRGMTLAVARARAAAWSRLYQSGVRDLRAHLEQLEADERTRASQSRIQAETEAARIQLEAQRRLTMRQLFDRWASTELAPQSRADGSRTGRKDGGLSCRQQFERRVFPALGDIAAVDVRKADLLAVLDAAKAQGKLRTANVLLADLKQMFRFALVREIVERNPLDTVTKRDVGGAEVQRDRVLSVEELAALAEAVPRACMHRRSEIAVWAILATGCRVGELLGTHWSDLKFEARTWYLPMTKNGRDHTIHLSAFARAQFEALAELREIDEQGRALPWLFPNRARTGPVDVKSFGKQLADRQREPEARLQGRSLATGSLRLAGGNWTAHDLRRTAATLMATLGVSGDVIDECLNHVIESRVRRTYIRDRRTAEQANAFDALGAELERLTGAHTGTER